MDALKLIPQLFYDLISRILPGFVVIILLSMSTDTKIGKIAFDLWEGASPIQNSAFFLGFGFVITAYLVGQIISPVSDFIEKGVLQKFLPSYYQVLKVGLSDKGNYLPTMKKALLNELGVKNEDVGKIKDGEYRDAIFVWYDWLRVNAQESGANAAKVRAEYRMHSQNATAFLMALLVHVMWVATQQVEVKPALIVITMVAGLLSLWASARTYKVYQQTVIQQFYGARIAQKTKAPDLPI